MKVGTLESSMNLFERLPKSTDIPSVAWFPSFALPFINLSPAISFFHFNFWSLNENFLRRSIPLTRGLFFSFINNSWECVMVPQEILNQRFQLFNEASLSSVRDSYWRYCHKRVEPRSWLKVWGPSRNAVTLGFPPWGFRINGLFPAAGMLPLRKIFCWSSRDHKYVRPALHIFSFCQFQPCLSVVAC